MANKKGDETPRRDVDVVMRAMRTCQQGTEPCCAEHAVPFGHFHDDEATATLASSGFDAETAIGTGVFRVMIPSDDPDPDDDDTASMADDLSPGNGFHIFSAKALVERFR